MWACSWRNGINTSINMYAVMLARETGYHMIHNSRMYFTPSQVRTRCSFLTLSRACSSTSVAKGDQNYEQNHRQGNGYKKHGNEFKMDFSTPKIVYDGIPTFTLLRGWIVLSLCNFRPLVQNAEKLLRLSRSIFGDRVVTFFVKPTFFNHFCAGEDENEIRPTIAFLKGNGIGSILDFAAESDVDESEKPIDNTFDNRRDVKSARVYDYTTECACDKNVEIFEKAIQAVHNTTPEGFAAIKVTALGNPKLLERWSTALSAIRNLFIQLDKDGDGSLTKDEFISRYWTLFKKDAGGELQLQQIIEKFGMHEDKSIDPVEWTTKLRVEDMQALASQCIDEGPFFNATLSDDEIVLVNKMIARTRRLVELADKLDVALLIDAEHSYFQPAIDNIVLEMQRKYNRKKARVYNTFQCYLKETDVKLAEHIAHSEREDWMFACKLVRGAYMVLERRRAEEMGYPSPIHDTAQDTHACYNRSMRVITNRKNVRTKQELVNMLVATHNQDSIELAVRLMLENGIKKDEGVYFGQLFGMADHLTFTLGNAGYKAYKYLPYGPLVEVLPYLIRRAQENSTLMAGAQNERMMLWSEVRRRFFGGRITW